MTIITTLVIIKSMKINREGRQKKKQKKKELKPHHVPATIVIALYSLSLILTTFKASVVILSLKIRYLGFGKVK